MNEQQPNFPGSPFLTLEEATAGRATVYVGVASTVHARRNVLRAMVPLVVNGKGIHDALEEAGANTDNGSHYLCRYTLRQDVARVIARAASDLNRAKRPNKPADIVRHAIDTLENPRKLVPVREGLTECVA